MRNRLSSLPLILALILSLSACGTDRPAPSEGASLEAHFLDVGEADSALLLCGGKAMLIDGGNVADSSLVVSYLKSQGVDALDYLVCTHAHEDHVGGLSGALNACAVSHVLSPVTEVGNANYGVFHQETCANLPAEQNRVLFGSRDEAVAAGYTPCGNCKP